MTNLKGLPAHETRQCVVHSAEVTDPLGERVYTIFTFLFGAIFYSVIYGNIAQFIQAYYSSTLRYRKRMDEISEFASFHNLPIVLRKRIHKYLEFTFSVTKGISVESIVAQLPAHLQLEVHLELNKKLVEQVHIFNGCDQDFFDALVIKLQPCICVSGVFVFYDGEAGNKMYFVKHGMAEVLKNCKVVYTFKEGDYFGEIALLSEMPRTADVRAVTDCMLLSLSLFDFEMVLSIFPEARVRIQAAARARYCDLLAVTSSPSVLADKAKEDDRAASFEEQQRLQGEGNSQNGSKLGNLIRTYGLSRNSHFGGDGEAAADPTRASHAQSPADSFNKKHRAGQLTAPDDQPMSENERPSEDEDEPSSSEVGSMKKHFIPTAAVRRSCPGLFGGKRHSTPGVSDPKLLLTTAETIGVASRSNSIVLDSANRRHPRSSCDKRTRGMSLFEDMSTGADESPRVVGRPRSRCASCLEGMPPSATAVSAGGLISAMKRRVSSTRADGDDVASRRGSGHPSGASGEHGYGSRRASSLDRHSIENGLAEKMGNRIKAREESTIVRRSIMFEDEVGELAALAAASAAHEPAVMKMSDPGMALTRAMTEPKGGRTEHERRPARRVSHKQPPSTASDTDTASVELFTAISDGDADEVQRVLEARTANLGRLNEDGQTALTLAAAGEGECVRLLLNSHAPVHLKNSSGKTPLDVAIGYQDEIIVEMLLEAGAKVTVSTISIVGDGSAEIRDLFVRYVDEGRGNIDTAAQEAVGRMAALAGAQGPGVALATALNGAPVKTRRSVSIDAGTKMLTHLEDKVNAMTLSRTNAVPVVREPDSKYTDHVVEAGVDDASGNDTVLRGGDGARSASPRQGQRRTCSCVVTPRPGGRKSVTTTDPRASAGDGEHLATMIDRKLDRLRDEMMRSTHARDPHLAAKIERIEGAVMMMAAKLEQVLQRQAQGERWM